MLRDIGRPVAFEGLFLLAPALVAGREEAGLGNAVLLDLHAAEFLVEERVPLSGIIDEAVVEEALSLVNATLVGAGAYLGESGCALDGLLLLGRGPLLPLLLLLDLSAAFLVGRGWLRAEVVRDAGLLRYMVVWVGVEGRV